MQRSAHAVPSLARNEGPVKAGGGGCLQGDPVKEPQAEPSCVALERGMEGPAGVKRALMKGTSLCTTRGAKAGPQKIRHAHGQRKA